MKRRIMLQNEKVIRKFFSDFSKGVAQVRNRLENMNGKRVERAG